MSFWLIIGIIFVFGFMLWLYGIFSPGRAGYVWIVIGAIFMAGPIACWSTWLLRYMMLCLPA